MYMYVVVDAKWLHDRPKLVLPARFLFSSPDLSFPLMNDGGRFMSFCDKFKCLGNWITRDLSDNFDTDCSTNAATTPTNYNFRPLDIVQILQQGGLHWFVGIPNMAFTGQSKSIPQDENPAPKIRKEEFFRV